MKVQTPIKLSAADKRKLKKKVAPVTDRVTKLLGHFPKVTVTIERNGQDESLVLNTSQLDLDEESTE